MQITSFGTWTNSPTSYLQQWQVSASANGTFVDVPGATSTTYDPPSDDNGKWFRAAVRGVNAGGPAVVPLYSAAVQFVAVVTPAVPVVAPNQTFSVSETATVGAVVGTVSATNSPTAFAITAGNSAGRFAISNAGVLTLAGLLDYETATSYALSVTATNAAGTTQAGTVTVNVGDVAEGGGSTLPADGTGIAAAYSGAVIRTGFSGTPVAHSGGTVSAWTDQIGGANFGLGLTSDAPQSAPTYTASNASFNGRPSIDFDGNGQHMHTAMGSIPAATDGRRAFVFTFIYKSSQPQAGNYPSPFGFRADTDSTSNSDPNGFALYSYPDTGNTSVWVSQGGQDSQSLPLSYDTPVVVGVLIDGANSSLWFDDASISFTSGSLNIAGQLMLGANNVRGSGASASPCRCSFSDIIPLSDVSKFHATRIALGALLGKTLTDPGSDTGSVPVDDATVWPTAIPSMRYATSLADSPPKFEVVARAGGHPNGTVVEPWVQGFEFGHFMPTDTLRWFNPVTDVMVQTDPVNLYPDGSVRSAVCTTYIPKAMVEGEVLSGTLGLGAPQNGTTMSFDLLQDRSCVVRCEPAGGAAAFEWDVVAAAAAAAPSVTDRRGKIETRVRVETMVPAAACGGSTAMRLRADLGIRRDGSMFLDACWATDVFGGNDTAATYNAVAHMDGVQNVIQYNGISQTPGKRFLRERITQPGQRVSQPHARLDWEYQAKSAICHRFDIQNGARNNAENDSNYVMAQTWWESPLDGRGIDRFMPGTGARQDIGFWPAWASDAVISGSIAQHDRAVGLGEAGAAIPFHQYDFSRKKVVDHRDQSGSARIPAWAPEGDQNGNWFLDLAHAPDCGVYPWFATARLSMLDEILTGAEFAIHGKNGGYMTTSMIPEVGGNGDQGGQVRGQAWGVRAIDNAADFAYDNSADQSFMRAVSAGMWKKYESNIPEWQAKFGETFRVDGVYEAGDGTRLAPWQQGYFALAEARAVRRGIAPARTFARQHAKWIVGGVGNKDGWSLFQYSASKIAQKIPDSPSGIVAKTWGELRQACDLAYLSSQDWNNSAFEGNYQQVGCVTLSMGIDMLDHGIGEFAGVAEGYQTYKDANPKFTGPNNFRDDGTFNIIPMSGTTRAGWRSA